MKIRRQVNSLEQYLKAMKDETIRTDQECQRLSGQWTPNMVNELIYSVLTDNYIPAVILGEETSNGITRQWIIDGLQRSSTLSMFRYGNTRITKNIDEYMVTYQRKATDGNGNVKRDSESEIIWETVEYDIRNKTYEKLPEELKDRFNGYQLETIIHPDCDTTEVSKLVRKYNNNKPMNAAQRAFTYMDAFGAEIRDITTQNRFFSDMYLCSRNDKKNGTFERVVGEMVLLANYPEHFQKDTKLSFKWLNENGTIKDFDNMNNLLTRLTEATEITAEIRALFNSKNAHIFVAAFKAFTESGRKDTDFGAFLQWFVDGGNETEINGKSWIDWNENRSSRDGVTVHGKVEYLTALVNQYFKADKQVA